VINPEAERGKAFKALEEVIDASIIEAQELESKVVIATFHHSSLIELCKKKGFRVGDQGQTSLLKAL
jgi:hypothetical protein